MTSLGECAFCHGPLCVRGKAVSCERCGQPQADHALTRLLEEPVPVPSSFSVPHTDNVASIPERVLALEQRLAILEKRQQQRPDKRTG